MIRLGNLEPGHLIWFSGRQQSIYDIFFSLSTQQIKTIFMGFELELPFFFFYFKENTILI